MNGSQTLVVKLGTSVLTGGSLRLNRAHIVELVRQCAQQHAAGHRIVIVTSGAIAAGREHLGYPELPATIASKQLLAAVGQSRLIQLWEQLFSIYGIHVGQMLLTRADLEDRERFLNARDTMTALLDNRIVPVINENDAVATAEIKVLGQRAEGGAEQLLAENAGAAGAPLPDADDLRLLGARYAQSERGVAADRHLLGERQAGRHPAHPGVRQLPPGVAADVRLAEGQNALISC